MNINIDKQLIEDIKDALYDLGDKNTFEKLCEAIKQSEPKEIDYKNFGLRQQMLKEKFPKLYRNTNLNYLTLKRDGRGRFLPTYETIAYFGYPHKKEQGAIFPIKKMREILVQENNKDYIEGIDNEEKKYKRFRKDRIIGKIEYKRVKT